VKEKEKLPLLEKIPTCEMGKSLRALLSRVQISARQTQSFVKVSDKFAALRLRE